MRISASRLCAVIVASLLVIGGCTFGHSPLPSAISAPEQQQRSGASSAGLLYVAQPGANTVLIYKQAGSGQSPSGSLTNDLSGPEGVFVAANHDLYVTDFNTSKIVVFKKGAKSPYKTLSDAGQEPEDPVVDTTGTVYVTNFQTTSQGAGSISVYAGGSKKPTSKLKVPNNVDVLWCALDNAHNLYVGYFSTSGPALGKFKNGGGKLIAVSLNFQFAGGLKFDSTQDLLLADQSAGTLNVYELPKKNPTKVISTPSGGAVLGVAFNLAGKDVYLADATTGAVYEYSYPSGTLINTITKGLNTTTGFPTGIATDPSAPF